MQANDWPAVREIYREGIVTGHATFETELPDWPKWDSSHRKDCRLVARDLAVGSIAGNIRVLGWAALSPASSRRVYAGVAEVSVYVAAAVRGGRRWQGVARSSRQGIRGAGNLDVASGDLSREHRQRQTARVSRIPRDRCETPHRQDGRRVERCPFTGTSKHGRRVVGGALYAALRKQEALTAKVAKKIREERERNSTPRSHGFAGTQ
jgi:hypothetical protein